MSEVRWERIKDLVHQALQHPPEERARFLDEACGSDAAVRAEVESLLSVDTESGDTFLDSPLKVPQAFETGIDAPETLAEGQLFEQRFELVRRLGEGGMGQVWLAEQTSPVRRRVALKLIRAGMYDETILRRFRAERQSLAIMDHPAIAKVFDAGATPQGQPYFVMEYVPGEPITAYCDRHELSIPDRLKLFIQVCEGVQHAHQKAIIHRDLKPPNILVMEVDGKPVPRIIDFGLAKASTPQIQDEPHLTRFGHFIGTPGYMSPERVDPSGQDVDTRSDVYSLGAILYVLLTGVLPFDGKSGRQRPLDEMLRKLREEDPPNPSAKISDQGEMTMSMAAARSTSANQLVRLLRGDLDCIALKALERDRENRYSSPLGLAADLKRHLNDEPIDARPASIRYQLRKFIQRHRIAATVGILITLSLILASVAGLIAMRQKQVAVFQEHEAQRQTQEALEAKSRLLTQAAAARLREGDVAEAMDMILNVLADSRPTTQQSSGVESSPRYASEALRVFQEIRATDRQIQTLVGHKDRVYAGAWSSDGRRIVTASGDFTARIWDDGTGEEQLTFRGHTDRVQDAKFSPDARRVATASWDGTSRIWDAATGQSLVTLTGHTGPVESVAFSPDGERLVTASRDTTVRIWDTRAGKVLAILKGHKDRVYSATFSSDGRRIATASADGTARIWDAHTARQLAAMNGHSDAVYSAAFSPDDRRLVTASGDRTARIWNAVQGSEIVTLRGHGDVVLSAAFSPDGSEVVTASSDMTARIWDSQTGEQSLILKGHTSGLYGAAFSPNGRRIVTASDDHTARTWDAVSSLQLEELRGHTGIIIGTAYSPDGRLIATASADHSARIWDARSGVELTRLLGHTDSLTSVEFSPDGKRLVTASYDETCRIWDVDSGRQVILFKGDAAMAYGSFSPDARRIVTASYDNTAAIWDAATAKRLVTLKGHEDRLETATFSPDGNKVVTASDDNSARIWDAATGHQLMQLRGHTNRLETASFSSDGKRVITSANDNTTRLWDSSTGKIMMVLTSHTGTPDYAGFSPDDRRFVTTADDGFARIWDANTGEQLLALSGHSARVEIAAFSPDGRRLVTASDDKTARVWDVATPPLEDQFAWARAAQFDELSAEERFELGLPDRVRRPHPAGDNRGGAESGEPPDLARIAEQDQLSATNEASPDKRNILLLHAFMLYAIASERAKVEGRSDAASQAWRYRRASLARLLAHAGMMSAVAAQYSQALSVANGARAPVEAMERPTQ